NWISESVRGLALQSDGKIIVGGRFTSYNGTARGRVARLNTDGSLDTTFAAVGVGADAQVEAVLVQPDGQILVAGNFNNYNGTARQKVVRLNTDGSVDPSFAQVGAGLNAI